MRITIEISNLKLAVLLLSVACILWVPGYNAFYPIQRFGDDWYGPYVFYVGVALMAGLVAQSIIRRIRPATS